MSGVALRVLAADVLARLAGMEARGGNLTSATRFFGEYMKGSIDQNFMAQGRPEAWAPLALSTLQNWGYAFKRGGAYRTKKGTLNKRGRAAMAGRKILHVTGDLQNSFFSIASPRSLVMASGDMPKAAFHVFGTKKMPARNPLLFQDADVDYFEQIAVEFVMTGRLG